METLEEKKSNAKHAKSQREVSAPVQRESRRRNRGTVEEACWKDADCEALRRAIVAVTRHGFAIRFGYTRDGGAFAVAVVGDGDQPTDYTRPSEDINLYLAGLALDYE